jgi:N-acetyl-S-(2-succino)cysteine monooxygenase
MAVRGPMDLSLMIGHVGVHQGAWRRATSRVEEIDSLSFFRDVAVLAEQGSIDALFMADSLSIEPGRLRTGGTLGRLEPLTLLSALAACTERVGLIGSISTTFSEPFNVARQLLSLDHISNGRAGWNVVTSYVGEENFSKQELPSHAERYARAAEYLDVVTRLWDSWSDDAVVVDRAGGMYADPDRVAAVDFSGKFFDVAGPLNLPRSPQGRPVVVQAGASEDGKNLAARYAEVVFSAHQSMVDSRAFYQDLKRRVRAAGRDPGQLKVLAAAIPIIGATEQEALGLREELGSYLDLEVGLGRLVKALGGADLSGLELDDTIPPELLPPVESVQGLQTIYATLRQLALEEHKTIRQLIAIESGSLSHWSPIGSPEQIADQLAERYLDGCCDGFNVNPAYMPECLDLFVDGVIPELRRRGLAKTGYQGHTLRDHLGIQRPPSAFV